MLAAGAIFIGAPAKAAGAQTEMQAYARSVADAGGFSGVILAAKDAKILLHRAFGYADFELSVPMRTDSILRLASLTKPITATAALIEIEQGRLTLETSVCQMIDDCSPTWKSVTVRHLLSHPSGIGDYFGELRAAPVELTVNELMRVVSEFKEPPPL